MFIVLWYIISAVLWLLPRWELPEKPTLPIEIWMEVLLNLTYPELQRVKRLNKKFQAIVEVSDTSLHLRVRHSSNSSSPSAAIFARREALSHARAGSSARRHARRAAPAFK